MQRNVAIEAFAREGIAVWADEAHTQFRNVIDIFDEVAQRWPNMAAASQDMFVQAAEQAGLYSEELAELAGVQKEFNDLQQRDLSQAMAGIYRRNYLLALLQNWAKVDEVLIGMEDSLGYSMRENERTMQTLAKQYESLKAAAQEFAVALGDSGLLYELKGLVDGAKDVITWFNGLDSTLRNLIINFIEVTAAAKVFSAIMEMAGVANATSLLSGWAVPVAAATSQVRGLTAAMTGLGAIAANVGRGILGVFGGPWGLAFTAATAGVITLVNHMRNQQAQEQQNMESARNLAQEYDNLSQKLANTKQDTSEYTNLNNQLQSTMNAIAGIMPEVVTQWDAYGNAIAINNGLLRENIALANAATQANLGQSLSAAIAKQQRLQERFDMQQQMLSIPDMQFTDIQGMPSFTVYPTNEDINKTRQELANVGNEIKHITDLMAGGSTDMGVSIPKVKVNIGGGGASSGYIGGSGGSGGGGGGTTTDALKEQLQALTDAINKIDAANKQYEASLAKTGSLLSINASEYEYLTARIEAGTATSEEFSRAQDLVGSKINLLIEEQDKLHQVNDKYRGDVASLTSVLEEAKRQYEALQAAGDTEHMEDAARVVSQLQDKISSLSSAIDQNSAKWWDNQREVMEARQVLGEDYYKRLTEWMQHMESIGELTVEQQIKYYESIDRTILSLQSQWEIEERLYDLRLQSIQEQAERFQDAYEERKKEIEEENEATDRQIAKKEKLIEKIEEETNARVAYLQAQIDALEVQEKSNDRAATEEEHLKKIKELEEEKRYHQLRTGTEHLKAIKDIDKQIADEEQSWAEQQNKWAIEDQKEALKNQIDAIEKEAEKRKEAIKEEIKDLEEASKKKLEKLETYYKKAQKYTSDQTLKMIAQLESTKPDWFGVGKDLIDALIEGIASGDFSRIDEIMERIGDEVGSIDRDDSGPQHSQYWSYKTPINEIVWLKGQWDKANASGDKSQMDWAEKEAIQYYNQLPEKLAGILHSLNYTQALAWMKSNVYHEGGPVVSPYRNVPSLLESGEYVLNRQTVASLGGFRGVERLIADIKMPTFTMMQNAGVFSSNQVDRIVAAIVSLKGTEKGVEIGNIFNAEKVEFADKIDMEIFGRELARAVNTLRTAKGR